MMEHFVYIIASTVCNRTYVGYTVNPIRRLRQHNGEISGGAKTTRRGRPWRLVSIIKGFPDKRSALQFEWRMHHVPKKILRLSRSKKMVCPYDVETKNIYLKRRLFCLHKVLEMDKVCSTSIPNKDMNLQITFV
jgi:predicted GIY-YIG superfamily endonuclease